MLEKTESDPGIPALYGPHGTLGLGPPPGPVPPAPTVTGIVGPLTGKELPDLCPPAPPPPPPK